MVNLNREGLMRQNERANIETAILRASALHLASEWIPGRTRGELEVAEISSKPESDARADRYDDDVICSERCHAESANKIRGAFDTAEPFEDGFGARQVVDKHHGAGAVGADVEAHCRALPEHTDIARVLGVKRSIPIAKPADKGAAGFLAEDVSVGLAPLTHCFLDDRRQSARNAPEKMVAGVYKFVRRVAVACRRLPRDRRLRPGRYWLRRGRDSLSPSRHSDQAGRHQGNPKNPQRGNHVESPANPCSRNPARSHRESAEHSPKV